MMYGRWLFQLARQVSWSVGSEADPARKGGVREACRLNCGNRALLGCCMSQEHAWHGMAQLRRTRSLPKPHSLGAITGLVSDSCTALERSLSTWKRLEGGRVMCARGHGKPWGGLMAPLLCVVQRPWSSWGLWSGRSCRLSSRHTSAQSGDGFSTEKGSRSWMRHPTMDPGQTCQSWSMNLLLMSMRMRIQRRRERWGREVDRLQHRDCSEGVRHLRRLRNKCHKVDFIFSPFHNSYPGLQVPLPVTQRSQMAQQVLLNKCLKPWSPSNTQVR